MKTYSALLRVQVEPDGRLRPFEVKVADHDGRDDTTCDGCYTIQIIGLGEYRTQAEAARAWNRGELRWYAPLVRACPDGGLAVEYAELAR